MKRIAIFASGNGSNAENIARFFQNYEKIEVSLILSNNKNAFVLERAKNLGIKSLLFSKHEFVTTNYVQKQLIENQIDLVVLAGFLLKIPSSFIQNFLHQIINIHPSLLPKYGGKGMYGDKVHKAVIAANDSESGITIHYVNEEYDEGKIIFQAKCKVLPTDTYEDVAAKIHKLEYEYFPIVIKKILEVEESSVNLKNVNVKGKGQ